jgi:hypothetical protein
MILISGDDEEDDAAKSVRLVFVPILELSDITYFTLGQRHFFYALFRRFS